MGHTYAIIGCGAVGGYYGGCLQRRGVDVHFLVRSDRDHIRHHGLVVQSKTGDFHLPRVNVYDNPSDMPRCDVVVVAFKTTGNHLLRQILPNVMKDKSVVVMLQNGLGNEDQAAAIVGADRVLGGLCFVCAHKVGPGHIRHLDYGMVQLGALKPAGADEWLRQIASDFERAGISMTQVPDLRSARWQKLVWNIPYNGLSVLLNANTSQIMAAPEGRELAGQLMREVTQAAAGCGRPLPQGVVDSMLERTARMVPYQTSMKIDFDAKRPMEVEAIFGNPVRAATAAGVAVPRIATVYEQLKFLDRQNQMSLAT